MDDSFSNIKFDSKKYSPLVFEDQPDFQPGSIAYDDYWDEQDHRCLKGYQPQGMPRITGEHYFYLNMNKISLLKPGAKRKTPGSPFYRAIDRRLAYESEDAKKHGHGLIIGKPRRIGLSWWGAMLIAYELLFHYQNEVGVCAGKQDKADDFYRKVQWLLATVDENYRSGVLTKNDEELKLGFKNRINKQDVEEGLLSSMYIKTMYSDSSAFEGKSLSFVIFEEAGLFENLIKSYKATEPCFKDGGIQFGIPMIYGTGGEIEKGSKGYKEMWEKADAFNLKKVFIPAYEHYPGDGIPDEKTGKVITFFDMKTGETNKDLALEHILAERKKASGSKEAYTKHVQSYPVKESEIFIKSKGGVLDRILLNTQLIRLNDNDIPTEPRQGRLEWIDPPEAQKYVARGKDLKEKALLRLKYKSKVKFVEDPNGTVFKIANPINKDNMPYKPDIGGVDSYDDEVNFEENNNSFGASMIYRCYSGVAKEYNYPVAYVKERGDSSSDDSFYENTLKLAILYNAEMLVEYSKTQIITHFKDCGAHKYLRERPNLEATIGPSQARNEYGQRVNIKEKRLITRLLKSDVKENVYKFYFKDHLIELIDYGDINTDLAMAHGLCLIHKLDLFPEISEDLNHMDEDEFDPLMSMSYYDIENGKLSIKTYDNFNDEPEFEIFNPKYHATKEEKDLYLSKLKEEKDEKDRLKKEIEEKYGTDVMSMVLHDFKK